MENIIPLVMVTEPIIITMTAALLSIYPRALVLSLLNATLINSIAGSVPRSNASISSPPAAGVPAVVAVTAIVIVGLGV